MPANYVLLEKITVGAVSASSVTFSSIPQTGYTDLVLVTSTRNNASWPAGEQRIEFNGSSVNLSAKALYGTGNAGVGSYSATVIPAYANGGTSAANTFGSAVYYIPNYTSSTFKSVSSESVFEDNAAQASQYVMAGLWSSTSAITSITLTTSNNSSGAAASFVQGSTFYLYGVAKLNTTPAIAPKATGGSIIETDGTYWYHAFLSSGTFTPGPLALSCDVLVVAGGGGGGADRAGGGGAGGYRTSTSLSFSSAISVTVGAGGAGAPGPAAANGSKGSNSVISTITSTGGGFGSGLTTGGAGGSGGGAFGQSNYNGGAGNEGGFSPVEGYAGGNSLQSGNIFSSGGGGGAGGVGGNAVSNASPGAGGIGSNANSSWLSVLGLGVSGYLAGGGGGSGDSSPSSPINGGAGGAGGGGSGGATNTVGTSGTANTGGGGGGGGNILAKGGGAGGSGLVIVRYTV
jgi:hypothetical protein